MDPSELLIPINTPVLGPGGKMVDVWWKYFVDISHGLSTIDLQTQVTGVLPAPNGGTGVGNAVTETITLGGTLVTTGGNLTFTVTGPTSVTLPLAGTLLANQGLIKSQRVTTGTVTAGTSALVSLTWATAFADANYTAVASVFDATAATASLSVVHVEVVSASQVKVRVLNSAAGDLAGTLQVMALHD